MTERFQRMKDTAFQAFIGAVVTGILGVSGYIAINTVQMKEQLAVTNIKLNMTMGQMETTNVRLEKSIDETKENQDQIYKIRWELAEWKKERQESAQ